MVGSYFAMQMSLTWGMTWVAVVVRKDVQINTFEENLY